MNIDSRLEEIKAKIIELDNLIDDTLENDTNPNNEPNYGQMIGKLFDDTKWIDCVFNEVLE